MIFEIYRNSELLSLNSKQAHMTSKKKRGRYVRPKLNVNERFCLSCNVVENEEHFVTARKDNETERTLFTNKLEKETHHLPI